MKSIMHEASSLAKAIEQGWEKAGKPTDFSIKILEQPKRNFFGFTTHPAKIALYFDERPQARYESHGRPHKQRDMQPREQRQERHERPEQRATRHAENRPEVRSHEQKPRMQRPEPRVERPIEPISTHKPVPAQTQQQEAQWSEGMIGFVREWLGVVLPESTGKRIAFTVEPNNFYLRITFETSVLENQEKEKRLYASLALLILEALKRKFRTGLRRHKVILTNG
jgi:hypothetical protein